MEQDERNHNTILVSTFHDTSLDNTRLYMDPFMSLKLASNVSVYVKRKGSGNKFDCMEIIGFFFP